jgi:hypothetical protein
MRRLIVTILIAALTLGTFILVASAQSGRAPFWPTRTNPDRSKCDDSVGSPNPCKPVLTETYSDLPWDQKLGTYRGNEINEAFMLPYAALPPQNQAYCPTVKNPDGTVGLSPARCMIETGINNIIGTVRTDTFYNPQDTKIQNATRCAPNATDYSITPCKQPFLFARILPFRV